MHKRYIVRLTEEERETCRDVIRRLKGSSERVRRAQVLLHADVDGPGWTDRAIAATVRSPDQTPSLLPPPSQNWRTNRSSPWVRS